MVSSWLHTWSHIEGYFNQWISIPVTWNIFRRHWPNTSKPQTARMVDALYISKRSGMNTQSVQKFFDIKSQQAIQKKLLP